MLLLGPTPERRHYSLHLTEWENEVTKRKGSLLFGGRGAEGLRSTASTMHRGRGRPVSTCGPKSMLSKAWKVKGKKRKGKKRNWMIQVELKKSGHNNKQQNGSVQLTSGNKL